MAAPNPNYKDLRKSVWGVVFMGTPHQGSGIADMGAILAKIINVASIGLGPGRVREELIEILRPDCERLMDLSEGFRHETIKVITFYEMQATNEFGIVSLPSCTWKKPGSVN